MHYKSLFFLTVTAFALTFCGCSGDGDTNSTIGTNNLSLSGNVISGVASKGIIVNGKIKIYSLKSDGSKGDLIASASTNNFGEYAATVGSYTGPILVEASGGYHDEATEKQMTIAESSPLRAAYANVTGSTTIAVTPFTEMAVQIASATSLTSINISKANGLIAGIFNFDAINTKPLAVTVTALQTATQSQKDYSLALAALSQMANGVPIYNLIETMSTDIINHNNLTTTAAGFINALHVYLDKNPSVKNVVQATGGSLLELIGSASLSVNSIAIGPGGTLYAGINKFSRYSTAKINTFKSYSSVSVYRLIPGKRWELSGKIQNAVNSSWSKLIIDPASTSSPTKFYAGFDRTLFKGDDSGNWVTLGNVGLLEDIAVDSSSIVYLATLSSVSKSNYFNGSLYWDPINNGLPFGATIYSIAIDPTNLNVLYAGGSNGTQGTGIYKSTDGGMNWSAMNTGLTFIENGNNYLVEISSIAIAVDPINNTSTIYAASYNPNGAVFKWTKESESWIAIINGDSVKNKIGDRFLKVAVDPTNTSRVYVIGLNGLYYSPDGGDKWYTTLTTAGITRNIWDIVIDPNSNTLYAIYNGKILQGTFNEANYSISWTSITQ